MNLYSRNRRILYTRFMWNDQLTVRVMSGEQLMFTIHKTKVADITFCFTQRMWMWWELSSEENAPTVLLKWTDEYIWHTHTHMRKKRTPVTNTQPLGVYCIIEGGEETRQSSVVTRCGRAMGDGRREGESHAIDIDYGWLAGKWQLARIIHARRPRQTSHDATRRNKSRYIK